jgi:hypothetical protein
MATIIRVTILFVALRTEWERRHHGERAVIGMARIIVKRGPQWVQLIKGIGSDVRRGCSFQQGIRDRSRHPERFAYSSYRQHFDESKIGRLLRPGEWFALNAVNARQRRAVLMQLRNKFRRIFL